MAGNIQQWDMDKLTTVIWSVYLLLEDQLQHAGSVAPCGDQGIGKGEEHQYF